MQMTHRKLFGNGDNSWKAMVKYFANSAMVVQIEFCSNLRDELLNWSTVNALSIRAPYQTIRIIHSLIKHCDDYIMVNGLEIEENLITSL